MIKYDEPITYLLSGSEGKSGECQTSGAGGSITVVMVTSDPGGWCH